MKNNLRKYFLIKSNSKYKCEQSNSKKRINDTITAHHSKLTNMLNFKKILVNREVHNPKFKTNKNSRKYILLKFKFIYL